MTTQKTKRLSYTLRTLDNLPQVAANTQAREVLIVKIKALIAANNWTQSKAASLCNLTQSRISDLLRGNASRFSLDALVNITSALERHSLPKEGNTMEYTEAGGQRLVAEFMAKLTARPVKGRYPAATESSTTERGGKIIATSGISTASGRVALVGDIVRYPDGSESRIVSIVQYADDEPIKGLLDRTYVPPQPEGGQHG